MIIRLKGIYYKSYNLVTWIQTNSIGRDVTHNLKIDEYNVYYLEDGCKVTFVLNEEKNRALLLEKDDGLTNFNRSFKEYFLSKKDYGNKLS